jgi:signal transduction histidine kinase
MPSFKFSRPGWGLGKQITNLVALSLFAMVASVSAVTSLIINYSMTSDFIRNGRNVAAVLAEQAAIPVLVGSPVGARQAIEIIEPFASISQVAIYEIDGNALAEIGNDVDWSDANREWMFALDAATLELDSAGHWQFISPVFADNAEPELEDQEALRTQRKVTGLVRIRMDKSQLFEARDNIILGNFIVLITFALMLVLLLSRLTNTLTKPLQKFVKTMASGSSGKADNLRVDLAGSLEMQQLSNAFNQMMGILEDREAELASTRDQALAAARLKSEFAANVSHEIRTPLNGIVGTLSLLNESSPDAQQREYIELAESACDALMDMINDILDFSRLSLDESTLAATEFDLRSLLEELVALHARSKDVDNIDVLLYYETSLPSIVESDPNRIRQLLNNLINNAAKFTDSGSILVKAEEQTDDAGKLWVRIAVIDTGIGIDEKDVRTIFLPYAQSDGSMSRKYSGTGLGLAICDKLADLLHGDIGVSSEKDVGSEFFVRIPFRYRKRLALEDNDAKPAAQRTIGLYSSSATVRGAAKNNCDHQGVRTTSFSDLADIEQSLLSQSLPLSNDDSGAALSTVLFYLAADEDTVGTLKKIDTLVGRFHIFAIVVSRQSMSVYKPVNNIELIRPPLRMAAFDSALSDISNFSDKGKASVASVEAVGKLLAEGKRILLVEDNEINQRVATAMLKNIGCEVDIAENGADAIRQVEEGEFDLVFMDCQMPIMNGYDAARGIRELDSEKQKIPVVAMTANVGGSEQIHCFEAGMNDFLAKPVKLAELSALVSKWLL